MAAAGHAPKVVCIGPVTAAEARASGLRVHATADPHTIEGLVAAVERVLRGRARASRSTTNPASPSSRRKITEESGRS
jgi:hypothetical protein